MKRLPPLLAEGRWRRFAILIAFGIVNTGIMAASALLVRHAFDALTGGDAGGTGMVALVAAFGLLALLVTGLRIAEGGVVQGLGQHYVASVRLQLFDHLLTVPIQQLHERRRGHLMLRFLGDLNAVRLWVSNGVARLLVGVVTLVGAAAALIALNGPIGATAASVLLISLLGIAFLGPPLSERIRTARRRRAQLAGNVGEKLTEAAVIRAFSRTRGERATLRKQNDRLIEAMVSRAHWSSGVRVLPEAAALIATGAVILVGMDELTAGRTSSGTIVAALVILGALARPAGELARVFDYRRNYLVARDKIETFLAMPSLVDDDQRTKRLRCREGAVDLVEVTVPGVFDSLSVSFPAGAVTAVVGPNGVGKSTMLALIGGLSVPHAGRVLIDGRDLQRCTLASISRAVGIVSSELPLLRGSLRRNLSYRQRRAADDALAVLIRRCGLEDVIDALPAGLNTRVAEGGRNFSAGIRQRLMLARALLGEPPVLLLDETDAALDASARTVLAALMRERTGTTIIATHNRGAAAAADYICTLDEGRVVEFGAAATVLGRVGPTTRFFRTTGQSSRRQPASRKSA